VIERGFRRAFAIDCVQRLEGVKRDSALDLFGPWQAVQWVRKKGTTVLLKPSWPVGTLAQPLGARQISNDKATLILCFSCSILGGLGTQEIRDGFVVFYKRMGMHI